MTSRSLIFALLFLSLPLSAAAQTGSLDAGLGRAARLVEQGRLADAEELYRTLVDRAPGSRSARLGLARTLLWQLELDEAKQHFRQLIAANASDFDAREGLGLACYWSGDYRCARHQLERVVAAEPRREEAQRALAGIRAATAPGVSAAAEVIDDDQPLTYAAGELTAWFFSDPLTRWTVDAGTIGLDSDPLEIPILATGSADAPHASVAVETAFPSVRLQVNGRLAFQRFPDGEEQILGAVQIARSLGGGASLSAGFERQALLRTATAIDDHPFVNVLTLRWSRQSDRGWLSSAGASARDYYDGNSGTSADAWLLAPLTGRAGRERGLVLFAGASAAWADTDESRFDLVSVSSQPLGGGLFRYSHDGAYDPYWTPHQLLDVRLIAAAEYRLPRVTWKLQADGGFGRDEAVGFGPAEGTTPLPPIVVADRFGRDFTPWSVQLQARAAVTSNTTIEAEFARRSTPFYRSNEFRAIVARRF